MSSVFLIHRYRRPARPGRGCRPPSAAMAATGWSRAYRTWPVNLPGFSRWRCPPAPDRGTESGAGFAGATEGDGGDRDRITAQTWPNPSLCAVAGGPRIGIVREVSRVLANTKSTLKLTSHNAPGCHVVEVMFHASARLEAIASQDMAQLQRDGKAFRRSDRRHQSADRKPVIGLHAALSGPQNFFSCAVNFVTTCCTGDPQQPKLLLLYGWMDAAISLPVRGGCAEPGLAHHCPRTGGVLAKANGIANRYYFPIIWPI